MYKNYTSIDNFDDIQTSCGISVFDTAFFDVLYIVCVVIKYFLCNFALIKCYIYIEIVSYLYNDSSCVHKTFRYHIYFTAVKLLKVFQRMTLSMVLPLNALYTLATVHGKLLQRVIGM